MSTLPRIPARPCGKGRGSDNIHSAQVTNSIASTMSVTKMEAPTGRV